MENLLPATSVTGQSGALTEALKAGEAAGIMASIAIAKRFPRDETAAFAKVMTACKRPSLAEISQYTYSRGGTEVTGPSIHIAKAIASAWGNIEYGWRELERVKHGQKTHSVIEAFAWDKESNTRHPLTFNVTHWRDTRSGGYALTDERDIYELCANQAARRMRACILAIVPGDVVESAVLECDKTLAGKNSAPLIDRVRKMASAFTEHGVTPEMLETFLGCKLDACSETNLARLRKIFSSLRDGVGRVEDFFKPAKAAKPSKANLAETEAPAAATTGSQEEDDVPMNYATPPAAPEAAAETEAAPQAAAEPTPSEHLANCITGAGFSFDEFKANPLIAQWFDGKEGRPVADNVNAFDDLPAALADKFLGRNRDAKSVITNLQRAAALNGAAK